MDTYPSRNQGEPFSQPHLYGACSVDTNGVVLPLRVFFLHVVSSLAPFTTGTLLQPLLLGNTLYV